MYVYSARSSSLSRGEEVINVKPRERRPSGGFSYKAPLLRIGVSLPRGFSRKSKSMAPLNIEENKQKSKNEKNVMKDNGDSEIFFDDVINFNSSVKKVDISPQPKEVNRLRPKSLTPLLPLKRSNKSKKEVISELANESINRLETGSLPSSVKNSPCLKKKKGYLRTNSHVHFGSEEQLEERG